MMDPYSRSKTEKTRRQRKRNLKKRGFTEESFIATLKAQDGRCLICGYELGNFPQIDHDHQTGVTRGIICISCNLRLSWLERHLPTIVKHLKRGKKVATKITITLDPENYDLLRDTIKQERDVQNDISKDEAVSAPDRAAARQLTMQLHNLLNQL